MFWATQLFVGIALASCACASYEMHARYGLPPGVFHAYQPLVTRSDRYAPESTSALRHASKWNGKSSKTRML